MAPELIIRAKFLRQRIDTDWAYENAREYEKFAEGLDLLYNRGDLTGHEYNELSMIAFYDFEPKEEEE